jgi:predicted Fe-Mo cluster-binding NifX family protein
MRVAIAAAGTTLDAPSDPRFGRCQAFVVVDTDTMTCEAVPNTAAMQGSGAGIAAVQLVAGTGADAVIADNLGPNAFQALSAGGIQVFRFGGGTVLQAVEALVAGTLEEIVAPNVASHHGTSAPQASASVAAGADPGALTQQADALEAQLQDLRRQIAALQPRHDEVG